MMGLRVIHAIPGRFRLQGEGLRHAVTALRRLQEGLKAVEGVETVEITPLIGSILILFDTQRVQGEVLLRTVEEIAGMPVHHEETPVSGKEGLEGDRERPRAVLSLQESFRQMNADLFRKTGGSMDLRLMIPLVFVVYGTLKFLRQGPIPAIPWYTLYWWSFRTFMIFNRQVK